MIGQDASLQAIMRRIEMRLPVLQDALRYNPASMATQEKANSFLKDVELLIAEIRRFIADD